MEVTVNVIPILGDRLIPAGAVGIEVAMDNAIRAVDSRRIHAVQVGFVGMMDNAILAAALVARAECVVRMVNAIRAVDNHRADNAITKIPTTATMIIRRRRGDTFTGAG